MWDELQAFSIAYDKNALIQRTLGKVALLPFVLLALAMGLAGSFMDDPASGWQSDIPFAISVTIAVIWMVFLGADVRLLLTKPPAILVGPEGVTYYHAIWGAICFPWNRIGAFTFRSVTNPLTNNSRVFLDVLSNTPRRTRLFAVPVDNLAVPGPDAMSRLENFAAQQGKNHPERFVVAHGAATPRWQTYRKRIAFGSFLLIVFGVALIAASQIKTVV